MSTAVPPLLDSIPQDRGGPVFREPWEAQAFAMVVLLHQQGLFTWTEWADALSAQIAAVKARGAADTGADYYRHWLGALEQLLADKGIASADVLRRRGEHLLAHWPSGHDHVARREPVAIASAG
jgi:nitrile hydratase accessory protein